MPRQPNVLHKEKDRDRDQNRRPSFGSRSRKASFSATAASLLSSSPGKDKDKDKEKEKEGKRRANSSSSSSSPSKGGNGGRPAIQVITDSLGQPVPAVPPLPGFDFGLAKLSRETETIVLSPASTDSFSRMLSRTAPSPVNGYSVAVTPVQQQQQLQQQQQQAQLAPPMMMSSGAIGAGFQQSELSLIHQHIQEMANKRISTLDYLRKAHEGRVYWFNTLLFDKNDLQRMPYFDSRKLARRATNYLLLGLSLPAVTDLNSNNPRDFLASLDELLDEFEKFQANHPENGTAGASSLSRARIPQMFRRATAPSSKGRRSSNAATSAATSSSFPLPGGSSASSLGGGGGSGLGLGIGPSSSAGTDIGYPLEPSESNSAGVSSLSLSSGGGGPSTTAVPLPAATAIDPPASVMHFSASETDLLPGEKYEHLLTPSLPFDPDFFETFATLCDVLIDTYTRLLSLVPTPRECNSTIGELFRSADSKVRKIIIQGVIKEFEDSSRQGLKSEVANIGKVVLGGLM